MKKILNFEQPKKSRSTEDHNKLYISDCEVDGTFVPNMSKEDNSRWKAKHIKGKDERVEIRKCFGGTQAVIVVYKNELKGNWREGVEGHKNIRISANSKIHMDLQEYKEFLQAIEEAFEILKLKNGGLK